MSNVKAIFSTFKLQLTQSFGRPTFKFCVLAQPILYAFVLYMMYRNSGESYYVNHIVLGSGLCSLWSAICFSSAGDIQREAYMGTLENISSVPVPFYLIIFGKILANTLLGLLGMGISLISIFLFSGKGMIIEDVGVFIIGFIGMLITFVAISIVIAPIFTLSKEARILMNCMEYPIFILCGLVVPVKVLPLGIRVISYLLPQTWGTILVRGSADGTLVGGDFIKVLLLCIGISVFYIGISIFLFKEIDKNTRIDATWGVS